MRSELKLEVIPLEAGQRQEYLILLDAEESSESFRTFNRSTDPRVESTQGADYLRADTVKIKRRFLSEMLQLYCLDIERRYPSNFQIRLLSSHFTLTERRKPFLCVF